MPQPLLCDPDVFPSDEVIFANLGKARRLWEQVMDRLLQVCYDTRKADVQAACRLMAIQAQAK